MEATNGRTNAQNRIECACSSEVIRNITASCTPCTYWPLGDIGDHAYGSPRHETSLGALPRRPRLVSRCLDSWLWKQEESREALAPVLAIVYEIQLNDVVDEWERMHMLDMKYPNWLLHDTSWSRILSQPRYNSRYSRSIHSFPVLMSSVPLHCAASTAEQKNTMTHFCTQPSNAMVCVQASGSLPSSSASLD